MGCSKQLTLSAGCALESCSTEDIVRVGTDVVNSVGIAYAADLCYCCVQSYDAAFTESYLSKYEPSSNTLVKKATLPSGSISSNLVYDVVHQKFVCCAGSTVFIFDPTNDTVTTFNAGFSSLFQMVYVPQKLKIYGEFGVNGLSETMIGYIDLDINTIFQLGAIPSVGGSKPRPFNLIYVPSRDSLYGCWETGLGANLSRFDLGSNTGFGSLIGGGIEGQMIALDTDRNLIIVVFSFANEIDPATDTVSFSGPVTPNTATPRWTPFYSSSLKKVFGTGPSLISGFNCVASYNTQTQACAIVMDDYPDTYDGLRQFKDGSVIANNFQDLTSEYGVRRLCLT